jgi:hypothetical protein
MMLSLNIHQRSKFRVSTESEHYQEGIQESEIGLNLKTLRSQDAWQALSQSVVLSLIKTRCRSRSQ